MEKFYQQHKNDTRFSFIEFPIKGPDSIVAARVALAARLQPDKYLALHFALMNETDLVNEAMIYADAQKAGLNMAKLKVDMQNPGNRRRDRRQQGAGDPRRHRRHADLHHQWRDASRRGR